MTHWTTTPRFARGLSAMLAIFLLTIALLACKTKEGDPCELGAATSSCADGLLCASPSGKPAVCMSQARADDTCHAWDACKINGVCTFVSLSCVAAKSDDCKPSDGCKHDGRCTARQGSCVVGSEDDCRQSDGCKARGACFNDPSVTPFGGCTATKVIR